MYRLFLAVCFITACGPIEESFDGGSMEPDVSDAGLIDEAPGTDPVLVQLSMLLSEDAGDVDAGYVESEPEPDSAAPQAVVGDEPYMAFTTDGVLPALWPTIIDDCFPLTVQFQLSRNELWAAPSAAQPIISNEPGVSVYDNSSCSSPFNASVSAGDTGFTLWVNVAAYDTPYMIFTDISFGGLSVTQGSLEIIQYN